MNILIGGLIEGTAERAGAARVESLADLRALDHRLAAVGTESAVINSQIKALLVRKLYNDEQLKRQRADAAAKVGQLFSFLLENPSHISAGYRECLETQPAHRVVCDYIAGMTDAYFMRQYIVLLRPFTRV
jgi:dGTPase